MKRKLLCLALALGMALAAGAQDLKDIEKRVTEFTLANGLDFIVFERRQAPVVSFHTYVNAGSVNDPGGQTGIAHMFEHMAFKGTDTIGTRNYEEEKKALEAVEEVYDRLEAERNKGPRADGDKVRALELELKVATDRANSYVEPNMLPQIIEQNGGVGLNASTGADSTNYHYSLPANRLELWFLLESQRFQRPVFREFYKERDVVREERRMRIESQPQGRLLEALLAAAFAAHPYRNSPAGWASDIESLRSGDAARFFREHYAPANIAIGIAGDVNPVEARRLAEKYFRGLPKAAQPAGVRTAEPKQEGEKRVKVESPSQPFLLIGYKRPDQLHADDAALDVLQGILSGGRTGLLYKELVRDKKLALAAAAQAAFPGAKYTSLFAFFVAPSLDRTTEENEKAIYEILEKLKQEKVEAATLDRVKTKVRASVVRALDSNAGMAMRLTYYHVSYGNWRKLFTGLDEINKVTAEDVQRVARQYFVESGRTVAYSVKSGAAK